MTCQMQRLLNRQAKKSINEMDEKELGILFVKSFGEEQTRDMLKDHFETIASEGDKEEVSNFLGLAKQLTA